MGSIGLRWRLMLTYLLLVGITAGLVAVAVNRFSRARRTLESVAAHQARTIDLAVAALAHSAEMTRLTYEAVLADEAGLRGAVAEVRVRRTQGEALARQIGASLATGRERESFSRVEASCDRYHEALTGVERALAQGPARARAGLRALVPLRFDVDAQWRAFVASERAEIRALADGAIAQGARAEREFVVVIAAATLGGLLLASGMARYVLGPVTGAARVARQIAAGDLSAKVPVTRGDELGQLEGAIASMSEGLREFAERARGASVALTEASARNWAAARRLLDGSRAQREGTSDVSAALDVMTDSAALIAEWLRDAQQAPAEVRAAAAGMPERIARVTRALLAFEAVGTSNDATAKELWDAADDAARASRRLRDVVSWLRVHVRPRGASAREARSDGRASAVSGALEHGAGSRVAPPG